MGAILDTLVPTYRETLSPTPIPTYQGRSVVRRVGSVGDTGTFERSGEGSGKEFTWSRGLGMDISPIKTRSARKKEVSDYTTPVTLTTNNTDNGALRSMKSLAREKS